MQNTDVDHAFEIIDKYAHESDVEWIVFACTANFFLQKDRYSLAIFFYEKAVNSASKLKNGVPNEIKINLAVCYNKIGNIEKSKQILETILEKEQSPELYSNLAANYYGCDNNNKFMELSQKAYDLDPNNLYALFHLSHAYLAKGDYDKGFKNYWSREYTGDRKARIYHPNNSLHWDGTPGKNILVYGEQGLGDEIMFASILEDARHDCKELIFECNSRLVDLFRTSFPDMPIYGTKQSSKLFWFNNHRIDAVCGISCLAEFYRKKVGDFPRKPYIKSDAKYDKYVYENFIKDLPKKPLIGFSWKGGTGGTHKKERYIPLNKMCKLFEIDANFISLQYNKDSQEEIDKLPERFKRKIFHSQEIVDDYDYTASLVKHLKLIFAAPQSVVHLAGAMGKEVYQLTPKHAMWQMGVYGHDMPWYNNVKSIWQKNADDWSYCINEMYKILRGRINER